MLLSVVAAAGATVVLGASACGSTAGPGGAHGSVDSGSEGGDEITVCSGFCPSPEAGDDGGGDSGAHGLVDGGTD